MPRKLSSHCRAAYGRCTGFLSYVIELGGGRRNVMLGFNEGVCFILIGFAAAAVSVVVILAII